MADIKDWTPPNVWTFDEESGGTFASINRPTAGARFDKELPRGKHALQLYSLGTPNGQKVTILLEELLAAGHQDAEYDAWFIDIGEGEQFGSGFVELNPNSKIPVLLDTRQNPAQRVFESGSILLYLAESFGAFLPTDRSARTEALNWLFWQMGSAPYLGGGFGHFYAYAPTKQKYPINRFAMEAKRQLDVLDQHLRDHAYLAGDEYSIADIAVFPWYGALVRDEIYDGSGRFLDVASYAHVLRWANAIQERPAVRRGRIVNGAPKEGRPHLRERHSARDFDGLDLD